MKIHAAMLCYRDADVILPALDQLIDHVDSVIIMAGRFKWAPLQDDDGTVDLLDRYLTAHDKPYTIDKFSGLEYEIRTRALSYIPTGEYVFFLDTDERIQGSFPDALKYISETKADVYCMDVFEYDLVNQRKVQALKTKIFRVGARDYFDQDHWTVKDGKGNLKISGWSHVHPPYSARDIRQFRITNEPQLRQNKESEDRRLKRYALLRAVGWDERKLIAT